MENQRINLDTWNGWATATMKFMCHAMQCLIGMAGKRRWRRYEQTDINTHPHTHRVKIGYLIKSSMCGGVVVVHAWIGKIIISHWSATLCEFSLAIYPHPFVCMWPLLPAWNWQCHSFGWFIHSVCILVTHSIILWFAHSPQIVGTRVWARFCFIYAFDSVSKRKNCAIFFVSKIKIICAAKKWIFYIVKVYACMLWRKREIQYKRKIRSCCFCYSSSTLIVLEIWENGSDDDDEMVKGRLMTYMNKQTKIRYTMRLCCWNVTTKFFPVVFSSTAISSSLFELLSVAAIVSFVCFALKKRL